LLRRLAKDYDEVADDIEMGATDIRHAELRTVATANSVGFIPYLLASWGRLQVKIAGPLAAPRERERVFKAKTSSVRRPSETT